MKTLKELNEKARTIKHEGQPETIRYEYRVGRAGTSYAGQTGAKLHLVEVGIVTAFDSELEAKLVKAYPARASIHWEKVGEYSGRASGMCQSGRHGQNAVIVDGLDTDAISCSKCLAAFERLAAEVLKGVL